MMAKLWTWLPLWGKILLVLAILGILGVLVYFIVKFIVLIVILVGAGIWAYLELRKTNDRKGRRITGSDKRFGGLQSKNKDTGSGYVRSREAIIKNRIALTTFRESKGELSTPQEDKPHNAPEDELQFRQKFPAPHRATDGHPVRSKSELIIDNWLYTYRNRISHIYESRVPVEEVLYCDFCIEQGDKKKVYIEYWGYESDPKYLARKQKKQEIYEKYGFQLIELSDKEISTLDDVLPRKLREFGIEIE